MIAESRFDGMQTFDRSLLQLVRGDLVAEEDARAVATNPHDLSLAVHYEREDTRGSFEEDGYGEQGGAAAIVSAVVCEITASPVADIGPTPWGAADELAEVSSQILEVHPCERDARSRSRRGGPAAAGRGRADRRPRRRGHAGRLALGERPRRPGAPARPASSRVRPAGWPSRPI